MEILYAYVDGSDLEAIENSLVNSLSSFVESWDVKNTLVINNRDLNSPNLSPGDYPDWDLGLNIPIDQISNDKIDKLVEFLSKLSRENNIEFVVGYWNSKNKVWDDWCNIGQAQNQRCIEILKSQTR